MISMSAISDATGAASYYTTQAQLEYYANEAVPSSWGGQGLEIYGFTGPVEAHDLSEILAGKVKERGEDLEAIQTTTLGRTVIDKKTGQRVSQHRAGWDLTFAPPKSVSIESEVFGVPGVREAHEQAVKSAMDYLESNAAQTRVRHQLVHTGNLVYASFAHATSRAGDPQTHTHVLVANVTYFAGKAYSLSNEQLLRQRTTADAVYRNDLAHRLNLLGYTLDYDGRGNFEITGYDRAQLEEFSKRSAQIKTLLEERGSSREVAGHEARQTAALATRDDKALGHSESAAVHRERWQAEALAIGIQPARSMELDLRVLPSAGDLIASAAESLAEREQEFSKRDLVKEAMLQSSGRVTSSALLTEISSQAQTGVLVRRESDWTGERFTTPAAIAAERWADEQIRAGRDGHTNVMPAAEFSPALAAFEARKGFTLTLEQRSAARQILTGHDQFGAVQGSAGTGKTTMLEFVREAAQARGWTVHGMSNGAAQATKLEVDSGIPSITTASFLARHRAREARRDAPGQTRVLYINDEASMSGQRDFNAVIQASLDDGAKTVFVGDKAQHQSVTAGSAFERAQDQMQVSWLTQINRQKTEQARAPVRSIIAGNHAEAIRSTAREFGSARERVVQKWEAVATRQSDELSRTQLATKREEIKAALAEDNRSAIEAISRDYSSLPAKERNNTAVITATNADRRALNEAIRQQLIDLGELKPRGVPVATLQRKDLTRAQAAQASSYEPGDVLKEAIGRNSAMYLRVEAIDARENTLTVRYFGHGAHSQTLRADDAARMTAYARQEREFTVGDRVAFLENDKRIGVANGDIGTVKRIDPTAMTVVVDGKDKELRLDRYQQLDHGYVVTSHKAQGQTVDRTLIHHNTEGGMHGQREAYVNVTRARLKTVTYTQDRERASEQASRAVDKTQATLATPGIRRVPGSLGRTAMARGVESTLGAAAAEQSFVPARYADATINKPGVQRAPATQQEREAQMLVDRVAGKLEAELAAERAERVAEFTRREEAKQKQQLLERGRDRGGISW